MDHSQDYADQANGASGDAVFCDKRETFPGAQLVTSSGGPPEGLTTRDLIALPPPDPATIVAYVLPAPDAQGRLVSNVGFPSSIESSESFGRDEQLPPPPYQPQPPEAGPTPHTPVPVGPAAWRSNAIAGIVVLLVLALALLVINLV